MRSKARIAVLIAALALVGAACSNADTNDDAAKGDETPSLALGTVAKSVEGNVVTLPVDVEGIEIVKADGDTSGDTGHFHVFVDRDAVDEGETIPKERGVVHSADNPVKVWGLEPGSHEFTIVIGDGTHKRILGDLEDSATVDVEGPSVWGSAPATAKEGDDVTVELKSEGVEIVKPDGDDSGKTGHYHVLVDPATPPKGGDTIPAPEEGSVYHTPESSVDVTGLEKGEHILWIVLGDGNHEAFDPPVMDKLTVTVE
jgi:uncharacterized protein DUF4399